MAHGKKAYGEGLISKDRSQGILQTFAHFPHKKRRQGPKSGIAIFFMFVHVFYISAVTEGAFQNFAGRIFRKSVKGDKTSRYFVRCDVFYHVLADLVFVKGKAFLHDHICPYRLSAERIGMSYDSAFADAFHFIDAVFHFAGINIFTVHDDQVFDAVYNVNVSVSVHVYQVAGTEPAVFIEYFLCFFRFFQ